MTFNRFLAALAAGSLLFAACGDDDSAGGGGGDNGEYTAALVTALSEGEDIPVEEAELECLANGFVDALGGADQLEAAGITPEDIRDADGPGDLDGYEVPDGAADQVAASFGDCDISLSDLFLEEAGDDVPAEVRDCVADALDEDALAEFFAAAFLSDDGDEAGDDLPPEILDDLLTCF